MQSPCPTCGANATVEVYRSGRPGEPLQQRALIHCLRVPSKGKPRCAVAPCPVPDAAELATTLPTSADRGSQQSAFVGAVDSRRTIPLRSAAPL